MTNNQLAENSVNQLLNSVRLARDNAERADNRVDHSFYYALTIALEELQERRKAAMDSEPVSSKPFMYGIADPDGNAYIDEYCVSRDLVPVEVTVNELNYDREEGDELNYSVVPLYRHAQPAPVVPEEMYWQDAPVDGSTRAAAYATGWNACRAAMLQAGTFRENGNSSTNNFREIAETSTGTAITPAAPDKKLTDDVLDEIIAGAKTSMEQYLALSLKAERVAGNSPVIPDGYVMVPKEPTAQMYDAGDRQMTTKQVWDAMLAAAPQEVKGE